MWQPLDFKIDDNYKFIKEKLLFKICSDILYYFIAAPIIFVISKLILGLKIEGRENINDFEGPAISVSNHVHMIDCAMIGLAMFPNRIFYTASDASFKMPVIKYIVKLLNGLPISDDISRKRKLVKVIDELLRDGEIVHFYPEASLWPYYNKIRRFKNGAFEMSVKNNVPIIPMVYTYREVTGLRKLIKRKPFITLKILEPIYPDDELPRKERIEDLKFRVHEKMSGYLKD